MDTSDEYIAMCRHAREIQEIWQPEDGDFFYYNTAVETIGRYTDFLCPVDYVQEYPVYQKDCVWLPRLDQLLELFCHIREFKEVLGWQDIEIVKNVLSLYEPAHFNRIDLSLEKFFLMMLMEGGFGVWKWWDGEDWK